MFERNSKRVEEFLNLDIEVGDLVKSVYPSMSGLHGVVVDIKSSPPITISVRWNNNDFDIYDPQELVVVSEKK